MSSKDGSFSMSPFALSSSFFSLREQMSPRHDPNLRPREDALCDPLLTIFGAPLGALKLRKGLFVLCVQLFYLIVVLLTVAVEPGHDRQLAERTEPYLLSCSINLLLSWPAFWVSFSRLSNRCLSGSCRSAIAAVSSANFLTCFYTHTLIRATTRTAYVYFHQPSALVLELNPRLLPLQQLELRLLLFTLLKTHYIAPKDLVALLQLLVRLCERIEVLHVPL